MKGDKAAAAGDHEGRHMEGDKATAAAQNGDHEGRQMKGDEGGQRGSGIMTI